MQLPKLLLDSLDSVTGFERESFIRIHQSEERVTSVRVNSNKQATIGILQSAIPWCETGFYLASRPSFTFDPLFHAGCYYVQEASSMFLEQALKQTVDLSKSLEVLDLCAAPGGKSTHVLSLISKDSLLVSNEVIRSRANILNDNIIKWGHSNFVVTNNDPKDFQRLENYFDVIIVDAPCSGSGLFRRDTDAIEEWSVENVTLCSQRQKRILADVLPALKNDGVLIYSTCSYSKEEDELIGDWLFNELSIVNYQLSIDQRWNIVESGGGYRFWPDRVKGEGFFIACFKKTGDVHEGSSRSKTRFEKITRRETDILDQYIKTSELTFLKNKEIIHALPNNLVNDVQLLLTKLKVINFGTKLGEIMKDKLVPDHALAMSSIISERVQRIELNYADAIRYLKKKELRIETDRRGWTLLTFNQFPLGWVNILANRINNYYPKELRILKD